MVSLLFVPNLSVHTRYVSPKPFKKRVFGGQKKRKKEVTKKTKKTQEDEAIRGIMILLHL
jgi:hypothetical protein